MTIQHNVPLAPYTAFGVGGPAEHFALVKSTDELLEALRCTLPDTPLWLLGYGSNCLISDKGLPGMTICIRSGTVTVQDDMVIADAGAWWDDVVQTAIQHSLWGIELMSEIPGSVGGSAYINITAYGQSLGDTVEWIEVWDRNTSEVKQLARNQLDWGYKSSIFQLLEHKQLVILRVCMKLGKTPTNQLSYQKALDVAEELGLDDSTLENRRAIIVETRKRAGSLWHPGGKEAHTVGSFFRNPVVEANKVDAIIAFDESGKTAEQIKQMNQTHGGSAQRVSAAHVMLAAGFRRGQTWGNVRLNEQNLLKIEALPGANASDIYQVFTHIQSVCFNKLGVKLEPEARILGDFH